MKLKKILLPVIIGVVLMMASIVSVVTGTESEIKLFGSKGRVEAERLMYETPTSTTATDESMFTITKYDNLIYNGAEQTLMTITPLKGTVYYRVVEGTYSVSDALTSSNYSSYPSGGVGETITIKATEVGTYTIYYYIPAVSGSHSELSSSATVSIAKTKESNLFEISINSELVYTGSEQTLMTITPRTGVVYYDVQFGEYNETYASALANNYTSYAKGTENSTVTITATNAGTYTVYYYIPENDNYLAVSSSATITIENVSASVTINPNGGSWDGTTNNSTITQEANSSYAIADPVKEGYHLSSWNGGHTVLTPMELKNKVQIFDGDDYFEHYINYRGSYSKDKLFVSVEAYMDKWSDFSDMVLALDWLGGWSLRNDGEYVAFSICDTSGVTRTAHSLKKSSELESGWHTFVGSFDGEYARLYIDGVLQEVSDRSSGEIDYSYSYGYTFIGADSSGLVGAIADMSFFKGKMRNVYIANACVSSESITSPKPTDDVGYPAIHIASATTDTTLTAQWESNTYTIKFNAKGGTGTMANQTFKYGTEQALRLNAFEKGGYTFGGWTTEDYDLNTTPEAEYTNGHTIYNLTSNHNEQITLYAIWLSSYYTAHVYVMNTGGTYDTAYSAQTMEAGAGTTVTIADEVSKLDAVASDGGLMLDYATDASGNRITTATIGNNTIIKFYLKRSSYTLTFNANGGTVTETSRTLTYQQKYGTLPTPTRTGYECVGWYTEPIGGTPVNENTIMGTESVTIYAHWTANNYTVTFNANGGSVNPSTKSVTYDSTYGALPIPTRAGYNFECWGIGQTATATSNHTNITISNGAVTIGSTHKDTYFNINTAIIAGETYCITFDAEFTNYDSTAWTYNFYKMHGSSSSTNFSLVKGSNIVTVTPSASATSLTWDEVSNDFGSGLVISNIQVFRIVDKDTIVSTAENHTLTAQWSQRAPKVSITSSDTVIEYNSTDITFTAIGEHDFTLNYQWYRGASADFTPSDETKINGATSSTYIQRKDELNCGTYYYKCMVTADYADDTDLTATSDAIEIEITKTDNLFTDKYHPTLGELIYNGTEQVLLEVTATYGTIYYSVNEELDLNNESDFTEERTKLPTGINAGEYTIYYYVPASDNYNAVSGTAYVTIQKAKNIFVLNVSKNLEYNGNEQVLLTLEDSNENSGDVYYSIDSATNYTNNEPTRTNAGTYVVYFLVPESPNYTEIQGNVTVEIARTVNTIQVNEAEDLVYNGYAQVLLTVTDANNDADGLVYYAFDTQLDADNYDDIGSTNVPKGIKDGIYTVYFYIPQTTNYKEIGGFAEIEIAPKSTTLTINPNGGSWGGSTNNSSFTQNNGTTMIIEDPVRDGYTFNGWTSDKDWTTENRFDGEGFIEYFSKNNRATNTDPQVDENGVYIWDSGSGHLVKYNNKTTWVLWKPYLANGSYTLSYDAYNKSSNAGTTGIVPCYYNESGAYYGKYANNDNYYGISALPNNGMTIKSTTEQHYSVTFTIDDTFAGFILYYGGFDTAYFKDIAIIRGDAVVDNVYTFDTTDVTLTANWEAVAPTISISADLTTITYGQTNATLTATAEHEATITYQWYRSDEENFELNDTTKIDGATSTTYIHESTLVKADTYYYVCVATASGISTTSNKISITVNKSSYSYNVQLGQSLIYNGTEQELLEVVLEDEVNTKVYYSIGTKLDADNYDDSDEYAQLPKATNAGKYIVYFYIPETDNYNHVSGKSTVTIAKAENTFEVIIKQDLVYDGTEQELMEVIVTDGEVWYMIGTELNASNYQTGSTTKPTATQDDKYTVYFYVPTSDTSNYEELKGSAEAVIATKYTTLTINPNGGTWNGTDNESTFTEGNGTTKTIAEAERAGYTFTGWTYTNSKTNETITEELLVNKVYTFDITNVTFTANWSEEAPEISISTDKTEITYSIDSATLTAVAKHDLTISYQWYRSTDANFTPSDANMIDGATSATYIHGAKTTKVGTYYYICVATANGVSTTSNKESITVKQADNILTIVKNEGLIYNRTAQELLEAFGAEASEVYYSTTVELNKGNYKTSGSTNLPTGTDAKEYTIYIYIPENDNYAEITGEATVEIAKAENTFEVIIPQGLVYNGQDQVLLSVADSDGIINNVWYKIGEELHAGNYKDIGSTTTPQAKQSGTYTVYFYVPTSPNYEELKGSATNIIATKATTLTINPNGGTWNESSLVQAFAQNDCTTIEIPNPTRLGYSFEGWTYTNTDTNETIADELLVDGVYTFDINNVTFTANWKAVAPEISISADVTTIIYGESSATLTAIAKHDLEITYQWYRSDEENFEPSDATKIDGATSTTYVHGPKTTDAETYYYVCVATANGISTTSNKVSIEVKAGYNPLVVNGLTSLIYNGQAQVLVEVQGQEDCEVYFSIGTEISGSNPGSTSLPTRTDAGTYEIYFYAPAQGNYNEIGGMVEATIIKAENTFEVIIKQDLVYDGTEQELMEVIVTDGQVWYKIDEELNASNYTTGSKDLPTGIEDRTYKVYFYVPTSDTSNYEELKGSAEVVIATKYTTLTIDANGGTWDGTISGVEFGNGTTKTIADAYREGYTFTGWTYSGGGSWNAETKEFTYGVSDATLTAVWDGLIYQVSYNGNGATSGEMSNSVHTYDIEQALNENAYTKTGYKFSGWATTADGSVAYNDKEVVKNLATGGVFELFAVWTANTYQVEFNSNGGIGEMANQTFTYDVEQALSKNAYTRSGYEFSGWATTAGGQKVYDDEDIVGNLATEQDDVVELFAVWTASTYNVTFDSNGGSDCEAITVTYDAPYGELPTPTKDGYTFAGWGQEQDVTIKASVNTTLVDSIMTSTYSASSGTHEVFFSIATSIIAGETYCITYDAKVDSDGWSYQFYNMNGSTSSDSFNLINGRNVVIVTPQANRDYFTWDNVASDYENPFEISNVQVFRMVNQDTIVTTASDHTLIAQWTLDTHTITLDYQGGVDQFLYNDEGSQISGTFEFANDANRVEPADAYKFNGDYVLQGTAGEELTLNIGNTVGKYMVSFYVLAEKETTLNIYLEETNNFEIEEESVELLPNIWTYVGVEYEIISGYGNVNLILGTNNEITIYVDDIKVRRTDTYNIDYDYNYTIESEAIKLPYLVKPGYTFLGWKVVGEDGNVVGDILTTHASGQFGNVTYRAIYKVSNITATIESSDLSPIYGGSDTTITATTYSEGVDVDVTYYWYRNGIKVAETTTNTYNHANTLDAGNYEYYCYVRATINGELCDREIKSTSVNITVQKANSDLEISMEGYTYNGTISNPQVVTNTSGADVTFYYNTTGEATGGTEWTNMTATTLDAGTYYMYATTPATNNYYAVTSDVIEFVVSTATIEITTVVDEHTNKEENGYNFILTSQLDANGIIFQIGPTNINATLTYWIGDGEKTEVALTQNALHTFTRTDAGKDTYNYTITAPNYTTIEGTIELSIAVQSIAVEWVVSDSYTYNGESQASAVSAHIAGVGGDIACEIKFTMAGVETEFKNAGTYLATATLTGEVANNYTLTNSAIEIVMNKFAVTITADNKSMTYGDNAPAYTYQASTTTPDSYDIEYNIYQEIVGESETVTNDVTGTESTLSVGTYKITPSATLTDDNYTITYTSGILTVTPKAITKPSATGTYTYNGSEQTVTLVGFDANTMEILGENSGTDADDYQVVIALKYKENYTWSDSTTTDVTLDWSIAKFDLAGATIATIAEQPFTGSAVEPKPQITTTFATLVENTDFTYSYSNNVNAGNEAMVTITAVDSSNYAGTNSAYFTIAGAFISVPTISGIYTYNGTEQTVVLDGFDANTMEIVLESDYKATGAGIYTVEIALKNPTNYTWKLADNSTTKDNQSISWTIAKADVELSVDTTEINVRRGEEVARDVTVNLDYEGNLNGQNLIITATTNDGIVNISATVINTSNISTLTITPQSSGLVTVTVKYVGDDNHNASEETSFTVFIPAILVDIVVNGNIGGTGIVNGAIDGTDNEVEIGDRITFTATPDTGYGFVKYVIGSENAVYNVTTTDLTKAFTSPTITIDKDLIGTVEDREDIRITITLYFEEILILDINVDETQTGVVSHNIIVKYEGKEVAHAYADNKLIVFKNATIELGLTANYDEENNQYYVVNKLTVGDTTQSVNRVNYTVTQDVNGLIGEDGSISPISIQAAKVYNASDRVIVDRVTVNLEANDDFNEVTIDGTKYIIENEYAYYNIVENNPEYDFLGMRINGNLVLKSNLNATDWSYNDTTNTRTWYQKFTKDMSTAEPVILERWYTVENTKGRTVDVSIVEGVSATLNNNDINASYTLSNNVFDTGTDALYAGTWQVRVDSYTISDYMLRVYVYTKGNAIPTEYGTAAFNVTTDVEKIEIVIRAIDVTLNGISANLRNMDSDESTTLTEDRTIIENGKWKVVVDSLPENYEVKVLVYTSAGGNPTDYGTNEFTINSNVNKVEILIQEKVTV